MRCTKTMRYLTLQEVQRTIYFIVGVLFIGVGTLRIFLPLLPTTIFFIFASWCFVRSSTRVNEWLKNHKIWGAYIRDYQNKTGFTIKEKIFSLIFLWGMISLSIFFLTDEFYIKIILALIAIAVTFHILIIKNLTRG